MTARYQKIAITLYIAVLVATMLYIFNRHFQVPPSLPVGRGAGSIHPRPPQQIPLWVAITGNMTITTLLIVLELQLTNKSLRNLSRIAAATHLGLRLFLVTGLIFLGRGLFTVYMLYPILLFTFFTYERKVAYGYAFASIIIVTVYVRSLSPRPLLESIDLSNLLVYLLGLLLVLLLANVLLQEQETNLQLKETNERLEESHAKLKEYSTRVATLSATDERNRLARDIHDSLGHHLMASRIQLEKAGLFLDQDINETAIALGHAQRTIGEALTEVRTSVKALREQVERFDFVPELNDLINRMRHHGLAIELDLSGDNSTYSTFIQMTLYRIIQEALTNIHRHANASQVTIDLVFSAEHASLQIMDNGEGFIVMSGAQKEGYGLQGIKERVALVGGRYEIDSVIKRGTVLSVTAPHHNEISE